MMMALQRLWAQPEHTREGSAVFQSISVQAEPFPVPRTAPQPSPLPPSGTTRAVG